MNHRQALLFVIEQLPDQQLVSLLALAKELSLHPSIENASLELAEEQLADLRSRLSQFIDEWDSPEMEMYDDYDAYQSKLQEG